MSSEEEKLDKFLKDIMSEVGLESPSNDYTKKVMLNVASLDQSSQKAKVTVILLGVLLYVTIATLAYVFFQSPLAGEVKQYILELGNRIPGPFSLQNISLIVGGFAFYLIVVKLVLAIMVLRQKQASVQYY